MGKPYTMRELKKIVDYLVEHRHYGEIKGRKMWMDLANTHKLDRTWQSLKETFLKRILPDIHNPYYMLSVGEIASFRGGSDVTGKHFNKLEIQTITDSSNSNDDHLRDNQQPSTSKAIPENKTSGEDIQCEKISSRNKSSTDTLVLETCGENADVEPQETNIKSSRSLRDLITYSEPLTPMLQEVLHDFDSDEDPPMQIAEDDEVVPEKHKSQSPLEIRQSRSMKNNTETSPTKVFRDDKSYDCNQSPRSQPGKIKSLKLKKTRKGTWESKGSGYISDVPPNRINDQKSNSQTFSKNIRSTKSMEHDVPNIMKTKGNASTNEKIKPHINCSNTSTDTPIPNNQEAFNKSVQPSNKDTAINGGPKRNISPQNGPEHKRSKGNPVDTSTNSDVQIIRDTEGTVVSITDTLSQHDSSKENIPNSKNKQHKDESNESKNCIGDITKEINSIKVLGDNNIATDVQKEAGSSATVNICSNTSADKNPCLNSVSLFDEQFSTAKYSGSESDEEAIKSKAKNVEVNLKRNDAVIVSEENKANNKVNNDVTKKTTSEKGILKKVSDEQDVITISESQKENSNHVAPTENPAKEMIAVTGFRYSTDSDFEKPKQKHVSEGRIFQKAQREKALANVFGFSSGGARTRVKHHQISKHSSGRRHSRAMEASSSSGQSTMTDSDDSPSPQRRNHHLKFNDFAVREPKPYRILSQMDGALFAVEGKRVYPIVRQDRQRMHFAELLETEEEHTEFYWKKKYEEEKIRADELARLLKLQRRPAVSPILQTKAIVNPTSEQEEEKGPKAPAREHSVRLSVASESKAELRQDNAVKIKFNRDNEIELECQFPHVDPLLEKMAKIFNMNVAGRQQEHVALEPVSGVEKVTEIESGSGTSTPLPIAPSRDPEIAENIKNKESEIFKQIELLDKMDQNKEAPADNNVTRRKPGRPKKSSLLSTSNSKEIITKSRAASVDKIHKKLSETVISKSPVKSDTASGTSKTKRQKSATVKGDATAAAANNQNKATTASLLSKSNRSTKIDIPLDDSEVRYKFPEEPRTTGRTKVANQRNADYVSSYPKSDPKIWSPSVTCNMNIESSLGYQDSDASFESAALRRRKRYPSSHFYRKHQTRIKLRRRSHPYLADDDTSEMIPSIAGSAQDATLNTEVYRSESYQLLGIKHQNDFVSTINTNSSSNQNDEEKYKNISRIQISTVNYENVPATLQVDHSHSSRTEEGNSSNFSIPLSPELSVVENISVSKEVLGRVEDEQPTLNETYGNNEFEGNSDCRKYVMSDIDVSLPLMGQDCEFYKERQLIIDKQEPESGIISESLLNKICTRNMKEQSSSDTLAVKLGNLLLESAKKIAQKIQNDDPDKENAMEVDTTVKKIKKARATKKRCSTPHKRVSKNTKASEGSILEQHLETCSYSGRKSCPPAIKIFPCDNVCHFDEQDNNNTVLDAVNTNRRGRNKKDIIKVKITRPKKDKSSLSKKDESVISKKEILHSSRKSVCTDSGINDESYFLQCYDDSIELIHNHSETCLQTNECLGDSIEFIQNKSKSIVSVDSDSMTFEDIEDNTEDKDLPDLFCDNAQDAGHLNVGHELNEGGSIGSTVYFTPPTQISTNSMMTEDLSDEIATESRPVRAGKWYICSDEETTSVPEEDSPSSGIGANLKQIFTLCAVPNLSTISENSRENNSKKQTLNTEEEVINNSQSI